jgi:hypothetical protein
MGETNTRLGKVTPANWTGENKCDECADTGTLVATVKRHTMRLAPDLTDAAANRKSQLPGAAYSPRPMRFFVEHQAGPSRTY